MNVMAMLLKLSRQRRPSSLYPFRFCAPFCSVGFLLLSNLVEKKPLLCGELEMGTRLSESEDWMAISFSATLG